MYELRTLVIEPKRRTYRHVQERVGEITEAELQPASQRRRVRVPRHHSVVGGHRVQRAQ